MEWLTHLIQERLTTGDWRPITLSQVALLFLTYFFVDDVMLFAKASLDQGEEIWSCLEEFCVSWGLKVNNSKTRVFFSNNVNHNRRTQLSYNMGFHITTNWAST